MVADCKKPSPKIIAKPWVLQFQLKQALNYVTLVQGSARDVTTDLSAFSFQIFLNDDVIERHHGGWFERVESEADGVMTSVAVDVDDRKLERSFY